MHLGPFHLNLGIVTEMVMNSRCTSLLHAQSNSYTIRANAVSMQLPTPCKGCQTGTIEDAWARFDRPYCKPCSTSLIRATKRRRFEYCYATWREAYPRKAASLDLDIAIYRRHEAEKARL